MKRNFLISGMMLFAITLTGCQGTTASDSDTAYNWGITMTAENVTPSGADVRIEQSGGDVTGELQTGTYYIIEQQENGGWTEVPKLLPEDEVAWLSVAMMLQQEYHQTFPTDWGWLYGELPAGNYRIGKPISDFRGTGDYDDCMYYAEFTIK